MVQMTRKQVYLRPDQDEQLRAPADARHASASELIREAVDRFLTTTPDGRGRERWQRHFEWLKRQAAALPGGAARDRGWTRDDLHERGSRR
jgi:Arc/MetJ-type ribon-helix-helix transcriptional regulator